MVKKIKTIESNEITQDQYIQLEGLRALYEKLSVERTMIMEAFADIIDLGKKEDYHYERGSYILQDNEGQQINLKEKLADANVKISADNTQ